MPKESKNHNVRTTIKIKIIPKKHARKTIVTLSFNYVMLPLIILYGDESLMEDF